MLRILQRKRWVNSCRYRCDSAAKTGSEDTTQVRKIINELAEHLVKKDEIIIMKDEILIMKERLFMEKEHLLLQTEQENMAQSHTIGELKVDLTNARNLLEEVTTKLLMSTTSLGMRSVFEIFRNWYIINNDWQEFVNSSSAVALSFKSDLDNASIKVKDLNELARQLYKVLSTDIHKYFKSTSTLFIVKDLLTFDQLNLMIIIANFVVHSDYIQIVTKDQWENIYKKLKQELV